MSNEPRWADLPYDGSTLDESARALIHRLTADTAIHDPDRRAAQMRLRPQQWPDYVVAQARVLLAEIADAFPD